MSISSGLSILIAFFIIKLYIARIRGQQDNLTPDKLRIETMEGTILYGRTEYNCILIKNIWKKKKIQN